MKSLSKNNKVIIRLSITHFFFGNFFADSQRLLKNISDYSMLGIYYEKFDKFKDEYTFHHY